MPPTVNREHNTVDVLVGMENPASAENALILACIYECIIDRTIVRNDVYLIVENLGV